MDYRKFGDTFYIRLDCGDEIIGSVLDVCKAEKIASCTYSGIGGCGQAEIQTYLVESNRFELRKVSGMLELVSMTGNIISDDQGNLFHHTHALLSYKENDTYQVAAGHIKSIDVSYTAEIELRPVVGGTVRRSYDTETGTGFWKF